MSDKNLGLIVLVGLGILGFLFLTSHRGEAMASIPGSPIPQRLKLRPKGTQRQYSNEERWSITYSPDGLPTEIIVHRNAKESNDI